MYETRLDEREILFVHNIYGYSPYVLLKGYSFPDRGSAVIFLHQYRTVHRALQLAKGKDRIPYWGAARFADAQGMRWFRDWESGLLKQTLREKPELNEGNRLLWSMALSGLFHEWTHVWGKKDEFFPFLVTLAFGKVPPMDLRELVQNSLVVAKTPRQKHNKEGTDLLLFKLFNIPPQDNPLDNILKIQLSGLDLQQRARQLLGIEDPTLFMRLLLLEKEIEAIYQVLLKIELSPLPLEVVPPEDLGVAASQGGLEERFQRVPELEQGV